MSIRLGRRSARTLAIGTVVTVVASGLVGLGLMSAASAQADPGPISQHTANQMTADGLPTEQIDNGVVWSVAVSKGIAYAGGDFSNVRPPGAAKGTNLTPRSNLVAINLSTGVLVTGWAPSVNGEVKVVTVSPDGSRIYAGGSFTTANGRPQQNVAAFDASTGALITSFAASTNGAVGAITATNSTVYVGGTFSGAKGQPRSRLAAFSASNGALLGWAPTADDAVDALLVSPDGSRVIVGGGFANVNGALARGSAALDAVTGASVPWAINNVVYSYNSTQPGAILSLSTDGHSIFGTAWTYGNPSNFEGTFSADPDTGNINWLEDCHGDTYGAFATQGAVYVVSHEHFCSNVGGFPDTNPRTWHRTTAFTLDATGTLTNNQEAGSGYGNFGGEPSPSMINWYPDIPAGTFTGQVQAAWAVSGNDQYIIEGGEFPTVNGVNQYGLVRFGNSSEAPNKRGPRDFSSATDPSVLVTSSTTDRVTWQTNWDQDDQVLTYSLYRSDKGSSDPVYTTTGVSQFWNRLVLSFRDSGLTAGKTYQYWVRVSDPAGNTVQSPDKVSVTMPTNFTLSTYAQDVLNLNPSHYWRLDESAGTTTGTDWGGVDNLSEASGVSNGANGAIIGDSDTAANFSGTSSGVAGEQAAEPGPNVFSVGAWFNTTTNSGGKIVGFGDTQTGTSSSYDRHIYMDNAGHIIFGVYNNATYTVSSANTYNDGQWHQVVGTLSATGMVLYVDGKRVGTNAGTAQAQPYNGYWRVGGDNLNSWPSRPASDDFAGIIDEVAVYPTALTLGQVQQQYADSGRTLNIPAPPTDAYGKAVYNDSPDLYWRLDDASGPTAADTSPNGSNGAYAGGVTYQTPSPVTGSTGTGVTFDGVNGTIGAQQQFSDPTVYSEEAWFKTTTTHGGKIIGFGNAQSGLSSNYDRHVYMENSGQLDFGVWTGTPNIAQTPGSYNDGRWHYVVATQGPDGMTLYVDGQAVAENPQTQSQAYTGYWRVGGDSDWGGDSPYFAGSIDEVAVYSYELSSSQVIAHYKASPAAPNTPPVASFTPSCSGLTCTFDASASHEPDGTIASYAWDFGDGTTSTDASPSHKYTAAGSYPVKLTVTDNQGATDSTSTQVDVTVPVNQPPTASFTNSCTGLTCSFDGSGSSDPDGTVSSYSWDFGDGSPLGSGASPKHTYAQSGAYTVALTVTDDGGATDGATQSLSVVPRPAHVVIVVEENRAEDNIIGSADAPYINSLATSGASFSHFQAEAHPSQPNYLALFSGSTQGVVDDSCPQTFSTANLGSELLASGDGFVGYSEGLPSAGFTGCTSGEYARKHNPWSDFTNVPASSNQQFSAFPSDYSQLPAVSFVIPNLDNDMHDGTIAQGDSWLQSNMSGYITWAKTHNSVFVVTFDEDDGSQSNTIPTIITGAGISAGTYSESVNHYSLLRTIEDAYGIAPVGASASTAPITDIWTPPGANKSPIASFTKSCDGLACSFDGTGSDDPDGTIQSYSWDFGDGGTATGAKPDHTYASSGSYTVKLTVTDNQGAKDTAVVGVTVSPNDPPVASFTESCTNLACTFDGSNSSDPDGTIASYAWDFGDGGTNTGAKPNHTFAAAGTYSLSLTVTDDEGSTDTTTAQVTVTGVPVYAADTFGRTVSNGWGSADTGGAYSLTGSKSMFSVANGTGVVKMSTPGVGPTATLGAVSAANINEVIDATTDAQGTGNGITLSYLARHTSSGDYRLKVRLLPGGVVHLAVSRVASGKETTIREIAISGLTYNTGDVLRTRFTVVGNDTTTLTGSIWRVGDSEPAKPQVSVTDSTAALQGAGSIGISTNLASDATNAPVTVRYDNLTVNGS